MATKNVRKVANRMLRSLKELSQVGLPTPDAKNYEDRNPQAFDRACARVARVLRASAASRTSASTEGEE